MPADETQDEPLFQTFTMRDYKRAGLRLIDLSYLEEMFTLDVRNEQGQPIRLVLTEKEESLIKRPQS